MVQTLHGRALVAGEAQGVILASPEPLSFWGGYDFGSGEIIDRRHPLAGQNGAGRILALPFTRGSSTTTAVLLEAVRANTAPAAILTTGADHFLALASVIADELYARPFPVIALEPNELAAVVTGHWAAIYSDGTVSIREVAET